jgi:hypothetical protein
VLTNVIVIIALTFLLGVYVSWRAGRLDRLHARVDGARAALDAALVRRSSVALELAASGLLDPATSLLLAGAAHDARASGEPTERTESDLTRALRASVGQPGFQAALAARESGDELLAELEETTHQVFLARRFYNDAVAATISARQRWLIRLLRLAGGAAMPEFFEIDDSVLAGDSLAADMSHISRSRPGGESPGPGA